MLYNCIRPVENRSSRLWPRRKLPGTQGAEQRKAGFPAQAQLGRCESIQVLGKFRFREGGWWVVGGWNLHIEVHQVLRLP